MTSLRRLSVGLVVASAIALINCGRFGPSQSAAGAWQASGIGHTQTFQLLLTQDGDTIGGMACAEDSGFLMFRNIPVTGHSPKVVFTWGGATFAGKHEMSRDQIAGDLGQGGIPLRFSRSQGGQCAGARVIP